MKRRAFIKTSVAALVAFFAGPKICKAQSPQDSTASDAASAPENAAPLRPPIEFIDEPPASGIAGFSDARSCTFE